MVDRTPLGGMKIPMTDFPSTRPKIPTTDFLSGCVEWFDEPEFLKVIRATSVSHDVIELYQPLIDLFDHEFFYGSVAFKFCNLVLISDEPRMDNYAEIIEQEALRRSFEIGYVPIRQLMSLRSFTHFAVAGQYPDKKDAKLFKKALGKYADLYQPPNSSDKQFNAAKWHNAVLHRGMKRFALLASGSIELFLTKDEAVLELFKHPDARVVGL